MLFVVTGIGIFNTIVLSSTFLAAQSANHVSYVASDNEEVLLTTISLKVKAESGEYIILRALLITDITYIRECRTIVRVAAAQLSRVDRMV
jgi:hypothetical protein